MESARLNRATVGVIAAALAVVVLAPVALSFHSLSAWGRSSLALTGGWEYVVPVALDAAALTCVALVFHAVVKADSASGPRLLLWGLVAASATANARRGAEISPDATAFYAAMPVIAMLLLDITLRRVRRSALAALGGLAAPLPKFRGARWLVAPAETWRAWCAAVRAMDVTSPAEALELARAAEAHEPEPEAGEGPEPELARLAKKSDAVRWAFAELGALDAPGAVQLLARRGVPVSVNYAHQIARAERRPALAAVTDNGEAAS